MCSNCTLHKNANLVTIGYTRVRVCISCVFSHAHTQKVRSFSPRDHPAAVFGMERSPTITTSSEATQQWLRSHMHSPASKSDEPDYDTEDYTSGSSFESSNRSYAASHNQEAARPRRRSHAAAAAKPSQQKEEEASDDVEYSSWTHSWPKPPVPSNEAQRLQALLALQILDTEPEKPFDMICDLAKARLACPMAAVSFMDEHRQWFKASVGLSHKMIPRKIAFCAYTIVQKEPIVVLDTLADSRFDHNPLVQGAADVRFYASAPILDPSTGHAIGSVFVLDTRPRESCDVSILERLAYAASENLPSPGLSTDMAPTEDDEEESPENDEPEAEEPTAIQIPAPPASAPTASSSSSTLTTTRIQPPPTSTSTLAPSLASLAKKTASGESMEMLLMRLLTQNTETQQQLAVQQISLSNTLGHHSTQIKQLMTDFARMEAKMEAIKK